MSVAELIAGGDAELPGGGAVLSAAGARVAALRRLAAPGRPLRLTTALTVPVTLGATMILKAQFQIKDILDGRQYFDFKGKV